MKKLTKKSKAIAVGIIVVVLLVVSFIIFRISRPEQCHEIIGDGYAMGTDPKPVVIWNSCNKDGQNLYKN